MMMQILVGFLLFNCRYGFLLLESVASQDPLSVSVAILHQFNILPEMYQVGYTKLFFRTGQVNEYKIIGCCLIRLCLVHKYVITFLWALFD